MSSIQFRSFLPLVGYLVLAVVACGCLEEFPDNYPIDLPTSPARLSLAQAAKPAAKPQPKPATEKVPVGPVLEEPTPDGQNWLSRAELEEGWIRLFDGHTLFGWTPNSGTPWSVVDGVIVGADGPVKGLLVTTTRWADYELRVDFRVAMRGNSGVFLRTPKTPKDPVTECYELNVCDDHPQFKSGSLVGRMQPSGPVLANGDWHSYHIVVKGTEVIVALDGQVLTMYNDATDKPLHSGFIGLQMNGGKAEFRNIYLKPLSTTPLFDGMTLNGWRTVPGSIGTFTVESGTIRVRGAEGRGFLETERTAGNFVLQFEALSNGDALNSGVFFRAMTGSVEHPSDGYEFQIQNGIKGGNRNAPADFGTGAIFRRAPARRVVSTDRQWLTATLVADGPHLTTWVDGVQVVDWTDDRPPHENPRQGLRTDPGHFSLQAHDPTTNLQFRALRLADLP
jgi:hypothetical protein